jgi:hypothetical protein
VKKSFGKALLMMVVCVLSTIVVGGMVNANGATLLFDFDDGVMPFWTWALDGVGMNVKMSRDNAIPGVEGYSIEFSADGNGIENAHCTTGSSNVTIPRGTKYISFYLKPISGEGTIIFLTTEIFGTRAQHNAQIAIHDIERLVETPPEGAVIEKQENGWYKVMLDATDVKYWTEWDPNGKLDFPLKETSFQMTWPVNGTVVLIDHIEYMQ